VTKVTSSAGDQSMSNEDMPGMVSVDWRLQAAPDRSDPGSESPAEDGGYYKEEILSRKLQVSGG